MATDDYILDKRIEFFFRKYAPRGYESEFHMDLMSLSRAIHAEAVKPYTQRADSLLRNMSSLSMLAPIKLGEKP